MKTFRHAKFQDPVYNFAFLLLWDITPDQFRAFVTKHFPASDEDIDDDWSGYTMRVTNDKIDAHIVAIRNWHGTPWDYSVLAHECFHVTHNVLSGDGIELSDTTKECYCYLLDSIVRRALELMSEK